MLNIQRSKISHILLKDIKNLLYKYQVAYRPSKLPKTLILKQTFTKQLLIKCQQPYIILC
jgi:hypothetical protein